MRLGFIQKRKTTTGDAAADNAAKPSEDADQKTAPDITPGSLLAENAIEGGMDRLTAQQVGLSEDRWAKEVHELEDAPLSAAAVKQFHLAFKIGKFDVLPDAKQQAYFRVIDKASKSMSGLFLSEIQMLLTLLGALRAHEDFPECPEGFGAPTLGSYHLREAYALLNQVLAQLADDGKETLAKDIGRSIVRMATSASVFHLNPCTYLPQGLLSRMFRFRDSNGNIASFLCNGIDFEIIMGVTAEILLSIRTYSGAEGPKSATEGEAIVKKAVHQGLRVYDDFLQLYHAKYGLQMYESAIRASVISDMLDGLASCYEPLMYQLGKQGVDIKHFPKKLDLSALLTLCTLGEAPKLPFSSADALHFSGPTMPDKFTEASMANRVPFEKIIDNTKSKHKRSTMPALLSLEVVKLLKEEEACIKKGDTSSSVTYAIRKRGMRRGLKEFGLYPEDEKPVDAEEDDAVEEQLEDDDAVEEQLEEDSTVEAQLGEDGAAEEQLGEDDAVEELEGDDAVEEQLEDDDAVEEQLGEDSTVEEQLGEDSTVEAQLGEDGAAEEQLGEDGAVEEQLEEDDAVEEQLEEDGAAEEQLGEDGAVEEQLEEDDAVEEQLGEGAMGQKTGKKRTRRKSKAAKGTAATGTGKIEQGQSRSKKRRKR